MTHGVPTVDERRYCVARLQIYPVVLRSRVQVGRYHIMSSGTQRIDHNDVVVPIDERIDDVRTDEARSPGDDDAHQDASVCSSGRRIVKRAPPFSLPTLMSPWCASTRPRAIASPSPAPSPGV